MKIRSLALALTLASATASLSHAGLVTYPNSASWTTAVSGITNVNIPSPSPNPNINFGPAPASVVYSGVTFSTSATLSDGHLFNIGPLESGFPAVLSSQLQTSAALDTPNILVTFASPVTAFSLDYATFLGTGVTFLLSNGDTFTQGSTVGGDYAVPDFVGATDTTPFTSVLITTPDGGDTSNGLNLNNVSFATVVPEPASLVMLGLGAIGLLAIGRRGKH